MSLEDTLRLIVREELEAVASRLAAQPQKHLLSTEELGTYLGVSRSVIRKMVRDGVPHVRPYKHPRFDLELVERWLVERKNAR